MPASTRPRRRPVPAAAGPAAPRLGAHMSIAGGLHRALERGAAAGCDVVQVFTTSSRQWRVKPLTDEARGLWSEARERTGVEPAMAHASYLINLASPRRAERERARKALGVELARCELLGIPYLVFHPGAHLGDGEARGIARIVAAVERLFDELPDLRTRLLFENTAGQGTNVGWRFEHLRDLLGGLGAPERAGVCLDTCHALAAGYDIHRPGGWSAVLDELDRVVGCQHVLAVHANDSKAPCGARVDRHEHIGRGAVGLRGFLGLVNEPRLAGRPMALETPKEPPEADLVNLAVLRALAGRRRVTATARRFAEQPLDRGP